MLPENNYEKYLVLIGQKIAARRHELGLKGNTVANALGIQQSELSKIECGKYKSLNITMITKIGEYLQLRWEELLPAPQ